MKKIENKITKKLKTKPKFLDQCQRPVSCFITMEWEMGKDRADNYDDIATLEKNPKMTHFLGGKIKVKPASEPSDIIWENRKLSEFSRKSRKLLTGGILVFVLTASFTCIFLASKKS